MEALARSWSYEPAGTEEAPASCPPGTQASLGNEAAGSRLGDWVSGLEVEVSRGRSTLFSHTS